MHGNVANSVATPNTGLEIGNEGVANGAVSDAVYVPARNLEQAPLIHCHSGPEPGVGQAAGTISARPASPYVSLSFLRPSRLMRSYSEGESDIGLEDGVGTAVPAAPAVFS